MTTEVSSYNNKTPTKVRKFTQETKSDVVRQSLPRRKDCVSGFCDPKFPPPPYRDRCFIKHVKEKGLVLYSIRPVQNNPVEKNSGLPEYLLPSEGKIDSFRCPKLTRPTTDLHPGPLSSFSLRTLDTGSLPTTVEHGPVESGPPLSPSSGTSPLGHRLRPGQVPGVCAGSGSGTEGYHWYDDST